MSGGSTFLWAILQFQHLTHHGRGNPACWRRRTLVRRAGAYLRVKIGVEWAGAIVLLLLFTPLLACLTVLLRCTSAGPAIYSQLRLGKGGKPFWIYKLRTMTHGCERSTGPVWSITDDPRVTRVGQWLRDTHLDELPQLWNVLKGDMGLIGPRPERPELASKIEHWLPEFRGRLAVRPGITGLAQVRMPADSDLHTVRQKLAHDLKYIERIGLSLDIGLHCRRSAPFRAGGDPGVDAAGPGVCTGRVDARGARVAQAGLDPEGPRGGAAAHRAR